MATANDTFTLDIEFAGMCMFVRDPTHKRMHVLLPKVGGHLARLFYLHEHGDECQPETEWRCESLDGVALDLTALVSGTSNAKQPVDDHVVDLSQFLEGTLVPRRHVDDLPSGEPVLCRVTLDDGSAGIAKPGIGWTLGDGARRSLAISVPWSIPHVEAPLLLNLGTKTLELVPQNNQIQLAIFNAPSDELPDSKGPYKHPDEPVHHFKKYYDLFDGVDASKKEVPSNPDPEQDIPQSLIDRHIGRRFTCIVAQAEAAS